jgi:hypothetical protein
MPTSKDTAPILHRGLPERSLTGIKAAPYPVESTRDIAHIPKSRAGVGVSTPVAQVDQHRLALQQHPEVRHDLVRTAAGVAVDMAHHPRMVEPPAVARRDPREVRRPGATRRLRAVAPGAERLKIRASRHLGRLRLACRQPHDRHGSHSCNQPHPTSPTSRLCPPLAARLPPIRPHWQTVKPEGNP